MREALEAYRSIMKHEAKIDHRAALLQYAVLRPYLPRGAQPPRKPRILEDP